MATTKEIAPQMKLQYVFIHQLSESEYIELFRIMSDPQTTKWLSDGKPWTPQHLLDLRNFSTKDYALPWATRNYFYWAIIARESDNAVQPKVERHVIGIIGLHPVMAPLKGLQIMYAIAPAERGHGYAPRAIRDIMSMEEVRADPRDIWTVIRNTNTASLRAIEKSQSFARDVDVSQLVFRGALHAVFKRIKSKGN